MGCPAKKVCNKAAGSALLRDEALVAEILEAVVDAVDIPVTLKIRTGWCAESNNGVRVARLAESTGIQRSPSMVAIVSSATPARPSTTPSPTSRRT